MKRKHSQALDALRHLLQVDFETATKKEMVTAEAAAQESPGAFHLMLAVKDWAIALATVCRLHVAECAEIYADCGEQDTTNAALKTVLLALCNYLWLPVSTTSILYTDEWPEQNAVRQFVLQVSGAPSEFVDDELVTRVLPRSEPHSRLARMLAGLTPTPPEGKDAAFLTVDETQNVVRGLEESFRNALLRSLENSYCAALLANYRAARAKLPAPIPPKKQGLSQYFDPARLTGRQREVLSLHLEHEMKPHQIAQHLGLHHSTIQEHIRAGKARLNHATEGEKRKKRAAKHGVDE